MKKDAVMDKIIVAIVISYKDTIALRSTIEAVKGQVSEVIVVDNASGLEYQADLRELSLIENVRLVSLQKNLGIAAALNIGVRYADELGAKWMLTLDQDTVVQDGMVNALLDIGEGAENIGVVAPSFSLEVSGNGIDDVEAVITSGNLVKSQVYKDVWYDDTYFIDSVDFDFCFRVRDIGWRVVKANGITMLHRLGSARIYKIFCKNVVYISHAPLRRYYMYRNHITLAKRHFKNHRGFIIKKTYAMVIGLIAILIFDKKRVQNIKFISFGLWHGLMGKVGEYE